MKNVLLIHGFNGIPKIIDSISIPMKDIGHMGKKSGLEKLPKVIEIIENE